ncbi:MAG: hypothetical protein BWY96_02506 [Spirochaetes bacterium ADurb.BinA120]|nr:MAG: hypothetical protein BWY96_02506 [Spirochaetes bacterium ADurb.BinA120]
MPPGEGREVKRELEVAYLFEPVEALPLFERLYTRLHHIGKARLGAKARDEELHLPSLLLVVQPGLFVYLLFLRDLFVELARIALNLSDFFSVYSHGVRTHSVHKGAVVGDEHELPLPVRKKTRKPADGRDVEVVGGLVEEQQVRRREKRPGQVEAYLEASGQL